MSMARGCDAHVSAGPVVVGGRRALEGAGDGLHALVAEAAVAEGDGGEGGGHGEGAGHVLAACRATGRARGVSVGTNRSGGHGAAPSGPMALLRASRRARVVTRGRTASTASIPRAVSPMAGMDRTERRHSPASQPRARRSTTASAPASPRGFWPSDRACTSEAARVKRESPPRGRVRRVSCGVRGPRRGRDARGPETASRSWAAPVAVSSLPDTSSTVAMSGR